MKEKILKVLDKFTEEAKKCRKVAEDLLHPDPEAEPSPSMMIDFAIEAFRHRETATAYERLIVELRMILERDGLK